MTVISPEIYIKIICKCRSNI